MEHVTYFKCGCVTTHAHDGDLIKGRYCEWFDQVFSLVVECRFSENAWQAMQRGIAEHLAKAETLVTREAPAGLPRSDTN